MHQHSHAIYKFTRAGTTVASRFAKLGEQLAKRGELHAPVPFFEFIPQVTGGLQSRDVHTDVGGKVPEDGVVGLSLATRPFTMALERLDLHFEARVNGSLPHRPIKVGIYQGADVRRDWLGILEQAVWTLKVARHHIPDLPRFEVGGHETFPGREIVASCQRLDSRNSSVGRVMDQRRHIDDWKNIAHCNKLFVYISVNGFHMLCIFHFILDLIFEGRYISMRKNQSINSTQR
jgi:hypothetical protein